ncbi:MAG: hypothetical protein V1659_05700 [Candidatus Woesearchaeota archaeon]
MNTLNERCEEAKNLFPKAREIVQSSLGYYNESTGFRGLIDIGSICMNGTPFVVVLAYDEFCDQYGRSHGFNLTIGTPTNVVCEEIWRCFYIRGRLLDDDYAGFPELKKRFYILRLSQEKDSLSVCLVDEEGQIGKRYKLKQELVLD